MINRSGIPVLLLHAFPLDARMWEAQVSALEQAGYETIAPNLPGREPDNDLGHWAERVLQLLPGDFIPVGCSMGGYLKKTAPAATARVRVSFEPISP